MSLKPEQITHINIVNWFEHNFPDLADDFHHFANERKCTPQEGRTLKRMGVKRGVADFFLAISCRGFHGLWLELKEGSGKLTPHQIAFLDRKHERGYFAIACTGFETAKHVILAYLDEDYPNTPCNVQKNAA